MTVPEFIFGKDAPRRGKSGTWNWTGPATWPPFQVAVEVQTAASRFLGAADGPPVVVGATCVVTGEAVEQEPEGRPCDRCGKPLSRYNRATTCGPCRQSLYRWPVRFLLEVVGDGGTDAPGEGVPEDDVLV